MIRVSFLAIASLLLIPAAAIAQDDIEEDTPPLVSAEEHFRTAFAQTCFWSDLVGSEDFPAESWELSWREEYSDTDSVVTLHRYFCSAGAYNVQFVYYIEDDYNGASPVAFAVPELDIRYQDDDYDKAVESMTITGFRTQNTLTNSEFDPETGTITSNGYWRGLGDASSLGVWRFTRGEFSLKTYDVDATYDGEIELERLVDYE
ncbi:DUF1176 domain-containing protein [Pelagibacterium montanilacus]|uniref:DUF1176 domain-containing protein n=1 Tax=Pelagibacterium montanilacus TaxID=2185280 RepID=UPI0013DFF369|nr:DUF1176 domain-containing protein [Pelagibacterium montanilacus]